MTRDVQLQKRKLSFVQNKHNENMKLILNNNKYWVTNNVKQL